MMLNCHLYLKCKQKLLNMEEDILEEYIIEEGVCFETETTTELLNHYCRVCEEWKKCDADLTDSLPDNLQHNINTFMECYSFVINENVELYEDNSNKLCTDCSKQLLNVYKFIWQAKAAEKRLQEKQQQQQISRTNITEEQICTIEIVHDEEEHTNFSCKVCNKKFLKGQHLLQHMRVHSRVNKVYSCDYCDKVYKTKSSWTIHMRLHEGSYLQCEYCEKKFSCNHELTVHKRFHTGDFPYICDFCGRQFAVITHLKQHILRHNNMKVECQKCGKLFTAPKSLHEHYHLHTGLMPYPCCYCERGYPSTNKYKYHLRKIHQIEPSEEELQKSRNRCPQKNTEKPVIKWVQVPQNSD